VPKLDAHSPAKVSRPVGGDTPLDSASQTTTSVDAPQQSLARPLPEGSPPPLPSAPGSQKVRPRSTSGPQALKVAPRTEVPPAVTRLAGSYTPPAPDYSAYWAQAIPDRFAETAMKDWTDADDGLVHLAWSAKPLVALDVIKWGALKKLEAQSGGPQDGIIVIEHPEKDADLSTIPEDIRKMLGGAIPKIRSGGCVLNKPAMMEALRADRAHEATVEQQFDVPRDISDEDLFENHVLPWIRSRTDMGDFDDHPVSSVLFGFGAAAGRAYNDGGRTSGDELDQKLENRVLAQHREIEAGKPGPQAFPMPANPARVRDESDESLALDERDTQAGSLMQDRMNALAAIHPEVDKGRLVGMALAHRLFKAPDAVG